MPNTVPIQELKDKNGDLFYPLTKVEAVFDDNGNTIDEYIDDKVAGKTGHQVLDESGTALAQKSKLQFMKATVVNDGDKTVVTPKGVTAHDPSTPQTTTPIQKVSTFNGRTGTVVPQSGDYTAAMVGALPTQAGSQGQLLGFTADNVVGAVNAPASGVYSFNGRTGEVTPTAGDYTAAQVGAIPAQEGSAGQILGFVATDTVGAMNPPMPIYIGSSGQVLGFTAANTVGAKDPTALFTGAAGKVLGFTSANVVGEKDPTALYTGSAGQVLGFTAANTVGAMDVDDAYIENYRSMVNPMFPPYPGETSLNGTTYTYGTNIMPSTGLWQIIMTNDAAFTKDGLVVFKLSLFQADELLDPIEVYYQTCFVPGGMSLVDGWSTAVKETVVLPLKYGTKIKFESWAVPQPDGKLQYTGGAGASFKMIRFTV